MKAGEGDEEKVVGWHHRFNGHELEQTPGDSEGQRSLGCCSPCGHKESDTTEGQNNNPVNTIGYIVLSAFVLTSRHPGPEIKILNLEIVILNEVSQREKQKHCMTSLIRRI